MIAYYPLNGSALDLSGNNRHGTVSGARSVQDRFGNFSSAYSFDGINDNIRIPHNTDFNSQPISISFWIKTDGSNGNQNGVIGKYTAASFNGWQVYAQGNQIVCWYIANRSNNVIGLYFDDQPFSATLTQNTWNHVVFTVDNSGGKIYVNNVLRDYKAWLGTPTSSSNDDNVTVGNYENYFKGSLDDIRIYNRAINSSEVRSLYNEPNPISSNQCPTAQALRVTTNQDQSLFVSLAGNDADGNALTYQVMSSPKNGRLSGVGNAKTYTPNALFYGTDSFSYRVSDGKCFSSNATVTVTVLKINSRPVAYADTHSFSAGKTSSFQLRATDAEGDALTYVIKTAPRSGRLTGSGRTRSYTPNTGFTGTDRFTFAVRDGQLESNVASVTINVSSSNRAPQAISSQVTSYVNTGKSIQLQASDADGNSLTYIVVSNPTRGALAGSGSTRIYTPLKNFTGTDRFTFKVNDGRADSNVATVTISVVQGNRSPVAIAKTINTSEGAPVTFQLSATDADGDALQYIITQNPRNGWVSGTGVTKTYNPNPGFVGSDSFVFFVSDGKAVSNSARVEIDVTAGNKAPTSYPQSLSAIANISKGISLRATDPDGDSLTYTIVSQPRKGTLSGGTGPNRSYRPNANATGTDQFTFRVSDGSRISNTSTVTISITALSNDAPIASSSTVNLDSRTASKSFALQASDPNGDSLTYLLGGLPSKGRLTSSGGNVFVYTPNNTFDGTDMFTFRVSDGQLTSGLATVTLKYQSNNRAPEARDAEIVLNSRTATKSITLQGTDADGDSLTYTIVRSPARGRLASSGGNVYAYRPSNTFSGSDSFTFRVSDGQSTSNVATVTLTFQDANTSPVVVGRDNVTAWKNKALDIVLKGIDADGDALTFSIVRNPRNGSVALSGSSLAYTPRTGYLGADYFDFRAYDGKAYSNTARISLMVKDPAEVIGGTLILSNIGNKQVLDKQGAPASSTVRVAVFDFQDQQISETYNVLGSGYFSAGTVILSNLFGRQNVKIGAWDISEPSNIGYSGTMSLILGGTGVPPTLPISLPSTFTGVRIPEGNSPPLVTPEIYSTFTDQSVDIRLKAIDPDGDALTYQIISMPSNGTLTGTAPNFRYTPSSGFAGQDQFQWIANDGKLDSVYARTTINVSRPASDGGTLVLSNIGKKIVLNANAQAADASHRIAVFDSNKQKVSNDYPILGGGYFSAGTVSLSGKSGQVTIMIGAWSTENPQAIGFSDSFSVLLGGEGNPPSLPGQIPAQFSGVQIPSTNVAGPSIFEHPKSVVAEKGTTFQMSVSAFSNSGISYQWFKNGQVIPGATGSGLWIQEATEANEGTYHCVVSHRNGAGSTESNSATVVIIEKARFSAIGKTLNLSITAPEGVLVTLESSKDLKTWETEVQLIGNGSQIEVPFSRYRANEAQFFRVHYSAPGN